MDENELYKRITIAKQELKKRGVDHTNPVNVIKILIEDYGDIETSTFFINEFAREDDELRQTLIKEQRIVIALKGKVQERYLEEVIKPREEVIETNKVKEFYAFSKTHNYNDVIEKYGPFNLFTEWPNVKAWKNRPMRILYSNLITDRWWYNQPERYLLTYTYNAPANGNMPPNPDDEIYTIDEAGRKQCEDYYYRLCVAALGACNWYSTDPEIAVLDFYGQGYKLAMNVRNIDFQSKLKLLQAEMALPKPWKITAGLVFAGSIALAGSLAYVVSHK